MKTQVNNVQLNFLTLMIMRSFSISSTSATLRCIRAVGYISMRMNVQSYE